MDRHHWKYSTIQYRVQYTVHHSRTAPLEVRRARKHVYSKAPKMAARVLVLLGLLVGTRVARYNRIATVSKALALLAPLFTCAERNKMNKPHVCERQRGGEAERRRGGEETRCNYTQ